MCGPAPESHQQRFKNIIGVVRHEYRTRTRLDGAGLERRQPQAPRACRNPASALRREHIHRLQRNAKLRAEPRAVLRIRIGVDRAEVMMHMNRSHKRRCVPRAVPRPCAQKQRSRVNPPAECHKHAIASADAAALAERSARLHADACASYLTLEPAIRGNHSLMLRRCACESAATAEVMHALTAPTKRLRQADHRWLHEPPR